MLETGNVAMRTGVLLDSLGRMKSGSASKSAGRCWRTNFSPQSLIVSRLRMLSVAITNVPKPSFSANL